MNDELVKGWVWRSPFREGDLVDVAAEWKGDHYEVGGIARPADRMIALFPHCSRGRARLIKNAVKWWFLGVSSFCALVLLSALSITGVDGFGSAFAEDLVWGVLGSYIFFGIATISMTRKWMGFVHLAERVFRTLGLPDRSNIDLVKSSKAQRKPVGIHKESRFATSARCPLHGRASIASVEFAEGR